MAYFWDSSSPGAVVNSSFSSSCCYRYDDSSTSHDDEASPAGAGRGEGRGETDRGHVQLTFVGVSPADAAAAELNNTRLSSSVFDDSLTESELLFTHHFGRNGPQHPERDGSTQAGGLVVMEFINTSTTKPAAGMSIDDVDSELMDHLIGLSEQQHLLPPQRLFVDAGEVSVSAATATKTVGAFDDGGNATMLVQPQLSVPRLHLEHPVNLVATVSYSTVSPPSPSSTLEHPSPAAAAAGEQCSQTMAVVRHGRGVVSLVTTHEYAEVLSFFIRPPVQQKHQLALLQSPYSAGSDGIIACSNTTPHIVIGSWTWSSEPERTLSQTSNDTRDVIHLNNVSTCAEVTLAKPNEHLRIVKKNYYGVTSRPAWRSRMVVTSARPSWTTSSLLPGHSRSSGNDWGALLSTPTRGCTSYGRHGANTTASWRSSDYGLLRESRTRTFPDVRTSGSSAGRGSTSNLAIQTDDVELFVSQNSVNTDYITGMLHGMLVVVLMSNIHQTS
jgi:hypothetical protein